MRSVPLGKGKNKEFTTPCLELLAVLIGVRAVNFVMKELRLNISKRILWTDSQCVLHWLKTRKPLSLFVENRVKEIKLEKDLIFRFVATDQNPSDLATRGLSVKEMMQSSLWWHGRSWLQDDPAVWTSWNFVELTPIILQQVESEARKLRPLIEVSNLVSEKKERLLLGMDDITYSSLRKLLHITVYIL